MVNNMSTIEIKKIGITKLKVDAIVNAANDGLWEGGGVCGAIFSEAGSAELTKACEKYGHCDTGSAVITPGFKLPAKYIIHAVGPRWIDGKHNEPSLLYDAYKSSLELAKENDCHSIAFPLISAGIFGYSKEGSWKKGIRASKNFIKKNPDYEIQIIFVVLDDAILKIGEKVLAEIESENSNSSNTPTLSPEEKQALSMWTMGLGDMNKLLNGESPLPNKTEKATRESWDVMEMPSQNITLPAQILVSTESMEILRMGHIPEVQEDHWFMYCDDDTIHYYRSWTGLCIYEAHYIKLNDSDFVIDALTINRDPDQYNETDSSADFELFMVLISSEIGHDPAEHWKEYFKNKTGAEKEKIQPGKYRHFKGKDYEVIGTAIHSETQELMVVYRALYGDYGLWVRPASMWNDVVIVNGIKQHRFEIIK